MNIKNLLLAFSILSVVFVSCKSTPKNPEVENYVDKTMPAFMKEELTIMKEFNDIIEFRVANVTKTDTSIKNIIIPKYTNFIDKLDTITIKDAELKAVHQQYINVSKSQLEYFSLLRNSLNDPINTRDTLNKKLANQNLLMSDWNIGIRNLCKKYDIEYLGN
jgi:GMP synthase PP-ATPase subunit